MKNYLLVGVAATMFFSSPQVSAQTEENKKGLIENIATNQYNDKGEKQGRWIRYNESGDKRETEYKNGIKHGIEKQYYGDDKILLEQSYINGQLDGWMMIYDLDGTVILKRRYENGELVE